jgi:hypothetical protein
MGGFVYHESSTDTDVARAFKTLQDEDAYENGNGGYSGGIQQAYGYNVVTHTPQTAQESEALYNKHAHTVEKRGSAVAWPIAKVTIGKATKRTLTVRAKTRDEAQTAAVAKIKKGRKGDVRVNINDVRVKGSPHSNKLTKKRLIKTTPKVRYECGDTLFKTVADALKHAQVIAKNALKREKTERYARVPSKVNVRPVLVVVENGVERRIDNAVAQVAIGRDDKATTWEVEVTVASRKVERKCGGWVFVGCAGE